MTATAPITTADPGYCRDYIETRDYDAPFDAAAEIVAGEEMARRLARSFKRSRKYPIEVDELESEAILVLTEAAAEYPETDTPLPFGAFAAQRIRWRLEDFIQTWYRLARHDYATGRAEVRRVVNLSAVEGAAGRRSVSNSDPAAGLYIEDCRRFADAVLKPRQKTIIDMRYTQQMTLKEIAKALGITHILARQIHCEAIAAMRNAMLDADEGEPAAEETDEIE